MKIKHSAIQLKLEFLPSLCENHSMFYSMAYVPGGGYCDKCNTLIFQSLPPDDLELGYKTATTAFYEENGHWTTQDNPGCLI